MLPLNFVNFQNDKIIVRNFDNKLQKKKRKHFVFWAGNFLPIQPMATP